MINYVALRAAAALSVQLDAIVAFKEEIGVMEPLGTEILKICTSNPVQGDNGGLLEQFAALVNADLTTDITASLHAVMDAKILELEGLIADQIALIETE